MVRTVVVRDHDAWKRFWRLDLESGERSTVDPDVPWRGWVTLIAGHQVALLALDAQLQLWVDGTAWSLKSLRLTWSTGDWSLDDVVPTCHFEAVDRLTFERRCDIQYLDLAWHPAGTDPSFDAIDHEAEDLLYWITTETSRNEQWCETYLAHLEAMALD